MDRPAGLGALASGGIVLVGAGVYAFLHGVVGVDFDTTPLTLGLISVLAGLLSIRRRAVGTGLVLSGWGTAVLLVDHGVVPGERATPAYMLGVGAGLLVAAALAPRAERGDWLTSGSIAALAGPLSLYLTYDIAGLGRWGWWAAVLVAWAGWEFFWGRRSAALEARAPSGAVPAQ